MEMCLIFCLKTQLSIINIWKNSNKDFEVPIKLSETILFIFSDMGEFLGKNGYLLSMLDLSLTFDTVDSDI